MTIAEVSKRFGLSIDTLRYYERIGLIPKVRRNKSGIRDYEEADCVRIEFVKCMRGAGIPVDALAEYVALSQQGDATALARKQILVEQRDLLLVRMEELQKTLDRLNAKIQRYEKILLPMEKELQRKDP